jgi:hypothetical protein
MVQQALLMRGTHKLSWHAFEKLVEALGRGTIVSFLEAGNRNPGKPIKGLFTVSFIKRVRGSRGDEVKSSMLELIIETRRLHATDPRDKIYALFSLLDTDDPPLVDYHLSVEDVFRDFTVSLVETEQDLSFLSAFDEKSLENPSSMGSWAPNWPLFKEYRIPLIQHSCPFYTTGIIPVDARFSEGYTKLTLRGILV